MLSIERIISPSLDQLNELRQPLTRGERIVLDFFHHNLDENWEIYIQPHMNGLRPDFVLLNPAVGIAVFEVKDWDLDAVAYKVIERPGKAPLLTGTRNGKTFSLQPENPVEKVYRYKQELFNLYCPRLEKRSGFAVITAGIIFPFADDDRVNLLFQSSLKYRDMLSYPAYSPVSGKKAIESGDLKSVFPEGLRKQSYFMSSALADDLRYWLIEPDFSVTQRTPLELDKNQLELVKTRTKSGYRRIKGAAGSGKSLVLASRAAELLNEKKNILVVTFNITLLHYLMDVSVRWPHTHGNTRKDITWLNYHAWCRRVCEAADFSEEYSKLWLEHHQNVVLDYYLPDMVSKIIEDDKDGLVERFDAILVDEGQDFRLLWWDTLRKVLKPNGEMLLVADATQDIYETAKAWTDEAMNGAGFRGDWASLPTSYRLPSQSLQLIQQYIETFLPKDGVDVPQREQLGLDLEECALRWVQVSPLDAVSKCTDEILRFFKKDELSDLAISDITFLCAERSFGRQLVKSLSKLNIKVVHTFDEDNKESRRQKIGFYMGDARVKATTLHSFKGWESRLLVVYVDQASSSKERALIYAGLTRLKRNLNGSALTVVCSCNELSEYGSKWPDFYDETSGARL